MSNEREDAKEFTKRPVKISARKWQKDGDHDHVTSLPGELWGETHAERYCKHCGMNKCNHGMIKTLEGEHIVCPGDWIIKGVKGEYYPCKPDIFEMTYAPAQQSAPAGWPTDDMVVRGAEELHDSLRMFGIDINFDTKTKGTEIQQEIVEAVFNAMLAAAPAQPEAKAAVPFAYHKKYMGGTDFMLHEPWCEDGISPEWEPLYASPAQPQSKEFIR